MFTTTSRMAAVSIALLYLTRMLAAEVDEFTDKDEWIEAVGDFAFIDFVGIPHGTAITNEFEDLGVTFTPYQNIVLEGPVPDGFALLGATSLPISFTFSEPQQWVATDYLGDIQFRLFLGEELVYESTTFGTFMVDFAFAGLLSSTPFDSVLIDDPSDQTVAIDNLYVPISAKADPDVNADGVVDTIDLVAVIVAWGSDDSAADVNADGVVNVEDLTEVIINWS